MSNALKRLVQLGTPDLGDSADPDSLPDVLAPILMRTNGFYAFESALLVRPAGGGMGSLEWWNNELNWREAYPQLSRDSVFFAEDVFGFQFVTCGEGFYSFDPETAELEFVGDTAEAWAAAILDDYEVMTGHAVGHDWQQLNGPLKRGHRLAPALPFVLGGEYRAEVLRQKADWELAAFRADVYNQIKDLPDGAQVKIRMDDN
ncbi:hypothetical protein ABZ807_25020 [Micromonospora sp. NPDC047548]|uniref:hypothetical protein n=1 Tax=Micromonospora sp. NPDC047548 TaxID=3155624 RepID=UPI0033F91216